MQDETEQTPGTGEETEEEIKEAYPEVTQEDLQPQSGPGKGQKFSSDSPTISEIIRRKKPNTRSCYILLDSALAHEIQELQDEIDTLEKRVKFGRTRTDSLADTTLSRLDSLREQLEAKEQEAEEFLVKFKFQDIGRKAYDELVRDNRASEDEKKEYKDAGGEGVLQYSTSSFPPKLVSAACIQPKIGEGEAFQIFDEWSEGDLELLFTTALLACKEPTSLPKSRAGIAKTQDSEQNSTTALNEESPTLNS